MNISFKTNADFYDYEEEYSYVRTKNTGPDGAVAMTSANGLVGTGFAFRY